MSDDPTTLRIRTSDGRYVIRIAPPRVIVERVDPRAPSVAYALSPEGIVEHLHATAPIWDGQWLNTEAVSAVLRDYEAYLERTGLSISVSEERHDEA